MPNLEDIAFKVIITKNPDYDIVFRTILLGASASQMAYNNSSSGLEATTVQGAIDELKTDFDDLLPQILPKGEASGSVASFETDYEYPLVKCECEFSASQASGTPTPSAPIPIVGVDNVNVTRTGKNLCGGSKLLANAQAYLPSGTTNLVNKTFTFTAWATMTQGLSFTTGLKFKENTQYTFIFVISKESGTGTNLRVFYTDGTTDNIGEVSETNTKTTIVYKTNANKTIKSIGKYNSSSRTTLYYDECGVFEGDLSETDFEPYNGTTVLINLGGTYYGGSVDAVTGKITLTHKIETIPTKTALTPSGSHYYVGTTYADMKNVGTTRTDDIKSEVVPFNSVLGDYFCYYHIQNICVIGVPDNYTIEEYNQNIAGTKIVYPLENPIVVYASNTAEIPTINGFNQVFADTGDVEVVYIESVNNAIDQKLAELTASMIAYNNTASGLNATNVQNAIDEISTSGNRSTLASLLRGSEEIREDNSLPLSEEAEREEMREPESTEER